VILNYHGVGDVPLEEDYYRVFVSSDLLERHVQLFRRLRYQFVSFSEMAHRASTGRAAGAVALTFDDGFSDNLTALLPLLQRSNIPATTFVIAGMLGERHPDAPQARILTAEQVRAFRRAGGEVGAHSVTHRDLTALSREEVRSELVDSKSLLEAIIEEEVTVLAYPFGRATAETAEIAAAAGYHAACVTLDAGAWKDPWRLPRLAVQNGATRRRVWLGSHRRISATARPLLAARRSLSRRWSARL
jgi:peptidoglycan/xylan/chitin deacetylase (PgdA/CDA1 family)